jgi:hypothetical protein
MDMSQLTVSLVKSSTTCSVIVSKMNTSWNFNKLSAKSRSYLDLAVDLYYQSSNLQGRNECGMIWVELAGDSPFD